MSKAKSAPNAWNSTLRRKKPLRSRKPWRPPERKAINRRSKTRAVQESGYADICREYRRKPYNAVCGVCIARGTGLPWSEAKRILIAEGAGAIARLGGVITEATENHHSRGRIGRLLCDTRFFISACKTCHDWTHANGRRARELELMAGARDWNVFPPLEVPGFPG